MNIEKPIALKSAIAASIDTLSQIEKGDKVKLTDLESATNTLRESDEYIRQLGDALTCANVERTGLAVNLSECSNKRKVHEENWSRLLEQSTEDGIEIERLQTMLKAKDRRNSQLVFDVAQLSQKLGDQLRENDGIEIERLQTMLNAKDRRNSQLDFDVAQLTQKCGDLTRENDELKQYKPHMGAPAGFKMVNTDSHAHTYDEYVKSGWSHSCLIKNNIMEPTDDTRTIFEAMQAAKDLNDEKDALTLKLDKALVQINQLESVVGHNDRARAASVKLHDQLNLKILKLSNELASEKVRSRTFKSLLNESYSK